MIPSPQTPGDGGGNPRQPKHSLPPFLTLLCPSLSPDGGWEQGAPVLTPTLAAVYSVSSKYPLPLSVVALDLPFVNKDNSTSSRPRSLPLLFALTSLAAPGCIARQPASLPGPHPRHLCFCYPRGKGCVRLTGWSWPCSPRWWDKGWQQLASPRHIVLLGWQLGSRLDARWVRQIWHLVEVAPEEDEGGAHAEEHQSRPEADVVEGLAHAHPVGHLLGKGRCRLRGQGAAAGDGVWPCGRQGEAAPRQRPPVPGYSRPRSSQHPRSSGSPGQRRPDSGRAWLARRRGAPLGACQAAGRPWPAVQSSPVQAPCRCLCPSKTSSLRGFFRMSSSARSRSPTDEALRGGEVGCGASGGGLDPSRRGSSSSKAWGRDEAGVGINTTPTLLGRAPHTPCSRGAGAETWREWWASARTR